MRDFTEQEILTAIENSCGIILNIAQKLNCHWSTAESYINKYQSCIDALRYEQESAIDNAENKMYDLINAKDPQMIRYFLSTKGKKRGYTEKQEIQLTGDDLPLKIEIIKGE